MLVIRPITLSDLDDLLDLLKDSGHGLTSLPKDKAILEKKIKYSVECFKKDIDKPQGEVYLFALEDSNESKLLGVSGIISKIGGFEPFYFYRIKEEVMSSEMLSKTKVVKSLHMEKIHSGPTEIGSLFLSPKYRNAQNGRFLSLSRFIFISKHQDRFEKNIIAEMRGRVNQLGESPFWDAVGKKFMDIDFLSADYLSLKSKSFIEELLPSYPILVDLLPKKAQIVIGEVHQNTTGAKKILEHEGFKFNGLVGIFEPGPVLETKVEDIRTIRELKSSTVAATGAKLSTQNKVIITNNRKNEDYRACLTSMAIHNEEVELSSQAAKLLNVKVGDTVNFVSLK